MCLLRIFLPLTPVPHVPLVRAAGPALQMVWTLRTLPPFPTFAACPARAPAEARVRDDPGERCGVGGGAQGQQVSVTFRRG